MMKKMKMVWLPLLMVGVLSVSWYYFSIPFVVTAPLQGRSEHVITMEPPVMSSQTKGQTEPANRLIFINFDDGRYSLTSSPDATISTAYGYRSTGGYAPYAESTEVYTDKEPPEGVARLGTTDNDMDPYVALNNIGNVMVSANVLSVTDPFKVTMSKPIQIEVTRPVVPESGVTYIVTVENLRRGGISCDTLNALVTLSYDADVLEYLNSRDGAAQMTYTTNNSIFNGRGEVTINLSNLVLFDQRSLVYVFKTRNGVTTTTPIDSLLWASIAFTNPSPGNPFNSGCLVTFKDTVKSQNRVLDAHDPNHKIIIPDAFCPTESTDLIFRVDFQNDGVAPTQNIVIEDELDFLYESGIAASKFKEIRAFIGGAFHSSPIPIRIRNRKFKFALPNAKLNGTNQPGYGTKFTDASTHGFLEFKISTDELQSKPLCNAVCNRARIFFDCKPPIETNTALSDIGCTNCDKCSSRNFIDNNNAIIKIEGGEVVQQQILPFTGVGKSFRDYLNSQLGIDNYYFKWYPASKVINQGDINSKTSTLDETTFTLIATPLDPSAGSGNCHRAIYQRKFVPDCSLGVSAAYTATYSNGCPEYWQYTITAKASGTYVPANLSWSFGKTCISGVDSISQINVPPGIYTVTVRDINSGCSAEAVIDIQARPIVVDDNPADCSVNLIVTGGTPPYTYQWQWDGQIQTHNSPVLDDMAGKNYVVVTVTDAKGCKKVFMARNGCSSSPMSTGLLLLSVLGVGATGTALWLFKKRNKSGKDG